MIVYEKQFGAFNLLMRVYGSSWPRASILAIPGTIIGGLLRALVGDYMKGHFYLHPYPYSMFATLLALLLIFRVNLSYARYWEGRTMVAQLSTKWADAAIQVLSFDEAAKEPLIPGGTQFRAEFLHTISLMHALAMQRLRGDFELSNLTFASFSDISEPPPVDSADIAEWLKVRGLKSYVVLRIRPHHYQKYFRSLPLPVLGGLNQTEKAIIASAVQEPVFLIFCWVHRLIVERRMAGGIREDAPIVSRIHQVLSDGMLGYENARKLCETPFPFPYAQGVALLLHLNSLGLPVLMANFVGDVWLTALSTFFAVMAFYLINEVAREIEEPFKFDPNELPVAHYQYKFNARLVTAFVKSVIPEGGLFSHIDGKELTGMICRRRPTLVPESGEDSGNNDKDFVELEQEPFQGQQTPLCRPSAPGSNHDR